MNLFKQFRHSCSHLPLIGPLFYAGWKEHKSSLKELIVSLLFSTVTFWGTAIFLSALQATSSFNYFNLVYNTISKGELFIFAVGLLGPILLATADDGDDSKSKIGRMWHIVALVVIALFASGFHSQIKAAQFENRLPAMNFEFLFAASVVISVLAVFLRYLALLYKKSVFVPGIELKAPEVDFSTAFANRHQEEPEGKK